MITDDKRLFIQQSGANKMLPPSKYIVRVFFRVFEVIGNLRVLLVIGVYFGAIYTFFYCILLFFIHFTLYENGLLGEDPSNMISYIVANMNLGVMPGAEQNSTLYWNEEKNSRLVPLFIVLLHFCTCNASNCHFACC